MTSNKLLSLIILGMGLFLQQAYTSTACETEKPKKDENISPPQRESIHSPLFRFHWEKPIKKETPPPPRQKVDIFGENPTFFVEDERVYFKPSNPGNTDNKY